MVCVGMSVGGLLLVHTPHHQQQQKPSSSNGLSKPKAGMQLLLPCNPQILQRFLLQGHIRQQGPFSILQLNCRAALPSD